MKMCSRITNVKNKFILRRRLWKFSISRISFSGARRGIITPITLLRRRAAGRLLCLEREDTVKRDKKLRENKGDVRNTIECLKVATELMDEVIHSPFLLRDERFLIWEWSLDVFMKEVRNLVDFQFNKDSRRLTEDSKSTVMFLCNRLNQMRLTECLQEQEGIRYQLKMTINNLFSEGPKWTEVLDHMSKDEPPILVPHNSPVCQEKDAKVEKEQVKEEDGTDEDSGNLRKFEKFMNKTRQEKIRRRLLGL